VVATNENEVGRAVVSQPRLTGSGQRADEVSEVCVQWKALWQLSLASTGMRTFMTQTTDDDDDDEFL